MYLLIYGSCLLVIIAMAYEISIESCSSSGQGSKRQYNLDFRKTSTNCGRKTLEET